MVNRTIANQLNLNGIPTNVSGAQPIKSPKFFVVNRPPTVNDKGPQYIIGTVWVVLNRALAEPYQFWYLADNQLGQPGNTANATWLRFTTGSVLAGKQITTLNDGNVAIPLLGNWNFEGLNGIDVLTPVNLAENITFTLSGAVAQSFPTDSGTATPAGGILNIITGLAALNSGSTVLFTGVGNTVQLNVTDASSNTLLGKSAGGTTVSGTNNSGFGRSALASLTTGSNNTGIASGVLFSLTTGSRNVAAGVGALATIDTQSDNVALGYHAQQTATGERNVTVGTDTGLAVSGANNVLVGYRAGKTATTAYQNVGVGTTSLGSITTGYSNAAVGDTSLFAITTQAHNTAVGWSSLATSTGQYNTAVGSTTSPTLSGNNNVIMGFEAAFDATSAADNVIIGYQAGTNVTTATKSVLIGKDAGKTLVSTGNNIFGPVAIGYQALTTAATYAATDDQPAVAIGARALQNDTDPGRGNVAVGGQSLLNLTGGAGANVDEYNTGVGWAAGQGWYTGSYNTFIGARAGTVYNANPSTANGSDNTAVGCFSMGNDTAAATVTAARNSCLGKFTGYLLTSGADNCFMGYQAGLNITTSTGNVAVGAGALKAAAAGAGSVAIGYASQNKMTACSSNTSVGTNTLENMIGNGSTEAFQNTVIGYYGLKALTTGKFNTALGSGTAQTILTGTNNVFIGSLADPAAAHVGGAYTGAESNNILILNTGVVGESNVTRIGAGTGTGTGQQNKCFISGIRGITTGVNDAIAVLVDSANQLGTVSSSIRYKENVEDMGPDSEVVLKLRPVTFNYKERDVIDRSPGLIAEEVEKVAPWLVAYNGNNECESVKYHELPVLLLNELIKLRKEVNELKLHKCHNQPSHKAMAG